MNLFISQPMVGKIVNIRKGVPNEILDHFYV